jgi:hypothetical protein
MSAGLESFVRSTDPHEDAKLVIAILVLNAAVRGGLAMWQYYQFKDHCAGGAL